MSVSFPLSTPTPLLIFLSPFILFFFTLCFTSQSHLLSSLYLCIYLLSTLLVISYEFHYTIPLLLFPPLYSPHLPLSLPPPSPSVHSHMSELLLCGRVPMLAQLPLATICCILLDPDSPNRTRASACGWGYEAAPCLQHKTTDSQLIRVDRRGAKHCCSSSFFRFCERD